MTDEIFADKPYCPRRSEAMGGKERTNKIEFIRLSGYVSLDKFVFVMLIPGDSRPLIPVILGHLS